jgi:hypothetical protein
MTYKVKIDEGTVNDARDPKATGGSDAIEDFENREHISKEQLLEELDMIRYLLFGWTASFRLEKGKIIITPTDEELNDHHERPELEEFRIWWRSAYVWHTESAKQLLADYFKNREAVLPEIIQAYGGKRRTFDEKYNLEVGGRPVTEVDRSNRANDIELKISDLLKQAGETAKDV